MVIKELFPVEVVFTPNWWHKNCEIIFDEDFFLNPRQRAESESKMSRCIYERFGDLGIGEKRPEKRPVIGSKYLSLGYFIQALLGCDIIFSENASPAVVCKNMTDEEIIALKEVDIETTNNAFAQKLRGMMTTMEDEFGYLEGDINWGGVQNIALDLRGYQLFFDYYDKPELVEHMFNVIVRTMIKFVYYIKKRTGSSSISVNPAVKHFIPGIDLHSNCTVCMVSEEIYRKFLLKYDQLLSGSMQLYGIHHCGDNMHIYARAYSEVPNIAFFDVGWGSDIELCRNSLPDAFFNLRLSPVKVMNCTASEIEEDIVDLVNRNGGIKNSGICCINMDDGVPDENIRTIFKTADRMRGF